MCGCGSVLDLWVWYVLYTCMYIYCLLSISVIFPLQSFTVELEKTHGTPRIVPGGFHLNPKGIELALKVRKEKCYWLWRKVSLIPYDHFVMIIS